ncbi:DUF2460 domain-containing protein [Lysobacter antibioticus]|uniref:DUF2460 domain-containing protein n=1 Tax=Lysobacter antibioticus TaxID=84531 RepID=UPI0007E8C75F|nr:DUF2460 domain-containing protein [Lysobacter antibioticus]
MAFINSRLSSCVAYGFSGGPEYSTLVVPLDNGREQRNRQWLYPLHRYSAQFLHLAKDAQAEIIAVFHAAVGRLYAFRFKDWNDYTAVAEPIAPAIGTSQPVQLVKTYVFGAAATTRLIQAPVGGVVVKRNGVAVAGTLDTTTGLFTPSSPWTSGAYTWDGEFDVWVRFASDHNAFAIGGPNASTSDIELVEVRL